MISIWENLISVDVIQIKVLVVRVEVFIGKINFHDEEIIIKVSLNAELKIGRDYRQDFMEKIEPKEQDCKLLCCILDDSAI